MVLADSGGVLQRGASPLHALRVRTLEAARKHGRHLSEISDHEGGQGEWAGIDMLGIVLKHLKVVPVYSIKNRRIFLKDFQPFFRH